MHKYFDKPGALNILLKIHHLAMPAPLHPHNLSVLSLAFSGNFEEVHA